MLTIWKRYAFPNTAEYVKRYQKNSYKLGNIRQFQTKLFLFPNYTLLIIINNLNKTKNTLKKSKYLTLTLITIHQIGYFLLPLMSFDVNIYRFKLKQLCFSFTFINFGIRFIADHFLNSYIWLLPFLNNFLKHSHRRLWGFSSTSNFRN